jgi:integrase
MRGHIRKRGSGYQIIVELGRDSEGKRKQKAVGGFKKKPEAERALAELITQIEKGEYFEDKNTTLEDYLKKWLDYVINTVDESTYIFYKNIIDKRLIPNLGKTDLDKLKPIEIQTFLTNVIKEDGLSSTTARHYYNVINIALNQAVKWDILFKNPCDKVNRPKKASVEHPTLNVKQAYMLLDYTKSSIFSVMYIPVHIALFCGMRRGEIIGLQWHNVDLDNGYIKVKDNRTKVGNVTKMKTPKTDMSKRSIELDVITIRILKQHKEEQDNLRSMFAAEYKDSNFVCCWPDGRPLRPDYVTQTMPKLLRACNLPDMTFHDLRHTNATMLIEAGTDIKTISGRLGHAYIDTALETYIHETPGMQHQAVKNIENLFQDLYEKKTES